jgi:hypothetical protein
MEKRQIDFVLAFPQANVECDMFVDLPRGVAFPGFHRSTHCLTDQELVRNQASWQGMKPTLSQWSCWQVEVQAKQGR